MDTTVAGIGSGVRLGCKREQFRRGIAPEAAASSEAGHTGVGSTGKDQSTYAFENDSTGCITGNRPIFASRAQEILLLQEGGTVLDPFIGAGTVAMVALRANRKFLGCELNPKFIAIAQARIDAEMAQGKLF